jgi:hypothetical protein
MADRRSERSLQDWDQRRALVQELTEPAHAAGVASEALRWLNHLLGRFESAADVYSVVGQLAYCQERLPQAMDGMVQFLERELAAGRLRHERGGDLDEAVTAFALAAADVQRGVVDAALALQRAQRAISGVGGVVEGEDG